ncbi:MAG TPA: ChaN family lipoprotein [Myxococcota bacterium]|nr:ChaN family lipoprotein [Myxococcota bacterium]HQK52181.1 ChaN family lipoprotein [Myxococcota bacterium]
MTRNRQLLELQRLLYDANERRIRELVAAPRRFSRQDLDRYEADLLQSVPSHWEPSTPAALRAAIRHARVVLVGDYHTLRQSQRGFLRVVRAIRSRRLILGLEFVSARYQKAVDDYLQGRIDDEAFLRRSRYAQSWPSYQVWPNFRPIFDLARQRQAPVVALDCLPAECGTVWSRAAFAAWRIAETLRERPGSKMAVLMGEAHLAPDHLPQELERAMTRLGVRGDVLVIHQNLDDLWFRMMARGLQDQVDVVRLGPGRFFVPVSTPIAAQASFLAAVAGEEVGTAEDASGVRREFGRYLRILARFLGVRPQRGLTGITVCGPGNLEPVLALQSSMDPETFQVVHRQVLAGESLCLPEWGVVYLAQTGPTHLGEEAAHFLKVTLGSGSLPADPVDFFYSRLLHEALGYLGSKVFNPKRKPPSLKLLRRRRRREKADPDDVGDLSAPLSVAVHLAGWHRARDHRKDFCRETFDRYLKTLEVVDGVGDLGPEVLGPLVHLLGYEMGERIWVAFRSGSLPVRHIRDLFQADLEAPGVAFDHWHRLAMSLRSVRPPIRF